MFLNNSPLAERMRPKKLTEYIGQTHLVGEGKVIRKVIDKGFCPSLIFWGPPGVGKTTLSGLIAKQLILPFYTLSAINAGVKQVREIIAKAQKNGKAILFIDEIHRFSKSQQDSLLGAVEKGTIILIGATTENPSFEVISALLSRCQVYVLKDLEKTQLIQIVEQAMQKDDWLKAQNVVIKEYDTLLQLSSGDARRMLNYLELLVQSLVKQPETTTSIVIDNKLVREFSQELMLRYDKKGEQHYDIISAFIKSLSGSDPNAAVYWLARMIDGGEDPKFIARRMLIMASEDIGNANPTAMVIANNCFDAVHKLGYPECALPLSQTAIYLAVSSKSNAAYIAIQQALKLVKQTGNLPVPLHLRNAPTGLMKKMDYGKNYQYAHDYANNFTQQEFLPDQLSNTTLFKPGKNPREQEMKNKLTQKWKGKYGF